MIFCQNSRVFLLYTYNEAPNYVINVYMPLSMEKTVKTFELFSDFSKVDITRVLETQFTLSSVIYCKRLC
mgnify:CR=1 FL=1